MFKETGVFRGFCAAALLVTSGACGSEPLGVRPLSREVGVASVHVVSFINGTVEATSWKQSIMRLQREGRTPKYAANGDVQDLIPLHPIGYAPAPLNSASRLQSSRARGQYKYLRAFRGERRGHQVEIFFLDSRPWQSVKNDPEGFLVMRDGQLRSFVKAKWVGPENRRRIVSVSMTNYDDAGKPGRLIQVDLKGMQLGCRNAAASGPSPRSLLARLVRLGQPRELHAQSLSGCIPNSVWDVVMGAGFDFLLESISTALGEAATMYDVLSVWDCVLAVYTLPRVPTTTVTCPPCFVEISYRDEENPLTGEIMHIVESNTVCPSDDECITTHGP